MDCFALKAKQKKKSSSNMADVLRRLGLISVWMIASHQATNVKWAWTLN